MRRVLVLVAVVAALVLAWGAVAYAAADFTNSECLGCHSAGSGGAFTIVDFSAPAVDYANCKNCHWVGDPATAPHPQHNTGMACGGCHDGWGTPLVTAIPSVPTTAGWFFSASSRSVDATALHTIHSQPRWPAGADKPNSRCASCHAVAACSACHGSSIPHGDHTYDAATGSRLATPWVGVNGLGTPQGNQAVLTAQTRQVTCSASTCHAPGAFASSDVYEESAATFQGSWSYLSDNAMSGGAAAYSTSAGASATVAGLAGARVDVYGVLSPNGGIAEILVDGSAVATPGCFASTQKSGLLYSGALSAGTHVVTVRNTGRNGAGGGKLVGLDYVAVFSVTTSAFVPSCGSCHPDRLQPHGYDPVQHQSTTTLNGCTGASCHQSRDLMTEHQHWRPDFICTDCHSSSARQEVKDAIANGVTACDACHPDLAAAHEGVHVESSPAECLSCHLTADPIELHKDSPLGGCSVCHDNPTNGDMTAGKTNTDCLQCHDYSPFDPKHYHSEPHMSSEPSDCDGCHQRELLPEHQASAGFAPPTECNNCHVGTYWENLDRPWNGKCDACHPTRHAGAATDHAYTLSSECSALCHKPTGDVSILHSQASTTTAGGETLTGCRVCHVSSEVQPRSTDCVSCHGPLTDDHGDLGTISGIVRDGTSGRPLAGAFVLLDGVRRAKTDRKGFYVLSNVVAGHHTLGASRTGYLSSNATCRVEFGQKLAVDLRITRRLRR